MRFLGHRINCPKKLSRNIASGSPPEYDSGAPGGGRGGGSVNRLSKNILRGRSLPEGGWLTSERLCVCPPWAPTPLSSAKLR